MSDNPAVEPAEVFYSKTEEAEPTKPTVEPVTEQVDQEPEQDVKNTDEPVKAEESEGTDNDENIQYLELDGKEYSLDEVRLMRDERLMQKDYTKKTTTHAQEVKKDRAQIDSDRENLHKTQTKVDEMSVKLEVLVAEDDAIDWVELKEDDPEEYIRLKEKADKRKEMVDEINSSRSVPVDDPATIQEEQGIWFSSHPEWVDSDSKTTDAYAEDMKLMHGYLVREGYTNEEFSRMTKSRYLNAIVKAAKYDQLQEKAEKVKVKRESVPLVTKPTAVKTSTESKSMEDVFYGS